MWSYHRRVTEWTTRTSRFKVVDEPSEPLFSLEACRLQCEVVPYEETTDGPTHPDDQLILDALAAAVDMAEDFTGLAIVQRTYEVALDRFPRGGKIELPRPPLIEVVSVTVGLGTDLVTLEPDDDYKVDDFGKPATIAPMTAWPSGDDVRIRYTAGYEPSTDGSTVPPAIRQAIMLALADWYANREDSSQDALTTLPNGALALLRPKRIRLGMA